MFFALLTELFHCLYAAGVVGLVVVLTKLLLPYLIFQMLVLDEADKLFELDNGGNKQKEEDLVENDEDVESSESESEGDEGE